MPIWLAAHLPIRLPVHMPIRLSVHLLIRQPVHVLIRLPAPVHPAAGPRTHPAGGAGAHPAVGARFIGHNRSGAVRWFTFGRVVAAEPGRRFAFTIHFGPIPISLWAYEFRATTSGCEVTESWTDHRPKPLRRLFRPIFGNRTPRNAHGIHTTLTRLKSTAESPPLP
jgi:hypothetical protein